jgi:hypothetical protein
MADGRAQRSDRLPLPSGPPQSFGAVHVDPSPPVPPWRVISGSADPRLRVGPRPADPRVLKHVIPDLPEEPTQSESADACKADACKVEEPPPPPPPWQQGQVKQMPPPPPPPLPPAGVPPRRLMPANVRALGAMPADVLRAPGAMRRRITVDTVCADAKCTSRCETERCNWCARHCPGKPHTAAVCIPHYDFPQRCTETSFWCLNKHPADPACRGDRCKQHCMDTACTRHYGADVPTRPSTNRTRGFRTQRTDGSWA